MKWIIEFEGRQRPLAEVWGDDVSKIIGPYKHRIEQAFATARDQSILSDIEIIFYVDDEQTWGVRFVGELLSIQYATDLVGPLEGVKPPPN